MSLHFGTEALQDLSRPTIKPTSLSLQVPPEPGRELCRGQIEDTPS